MTTYWEKTLHAITEAAGEQTSDRRLERLNMLLSESRGDVVSGFISLERAYSHCPKFSRRFREQKQRLRLDFPSPLPHNISNILKPPNNYTASEKVRLWPAATCTLSRIKRENFFMCANQRQPLHKTGSQIGL